MLTYIVGEKAAVEQEIRQLESIYHNGTAFENFACGRKESKEVEINE